MAQSIGSGLRVNGSVFQHALSSFPPARRLVQEMAALLQKYPATDLTIVAFPWYVTFYGQAC